MKIYSVDIDPIIPELMTLVEWDHLPLNCTVAFAHALDIIFMVEWDDEGVS